MPTFYDVRRNSELSRADIRLTLRSLLEQPTRLGFRSRRRAVGFAVAELALCAAGVVALGTAVTRADHLIDMTWYVPVVVVVGAVVIVSQRRLVPWCTDWKLAARRPRGITVFWWLQLAIGDLAKVLVVIFGGSLLWVILEVKASELQTELTAAVVTFVIAAIARVAVLYSQRRWSLLNDLEPFLTTVRQAGAPTDELTVTALRRLHRGLGPADGRRSTSSTRGSASWPSRRS